MNCKNIFVLSVVFLAIILIISCKQAEKEMSPEDYASHINEWDSARLLRLKAPDGWVNLAGLFWLSEGENSIGSAGSNNIIFPRGPEMIGYMTLVNGEVWFYPAEDLDIKADGERFAGDIRVFEDEGTAVLLTTDSLGFFIIRRGERTGIRLRDYNHPGLEVLQRIERYPPDQKWIIRARFVETGEELTVRVPDVLGDVNEEAVPGILEFEYEGESWKLYPTGSRDRLFIIFADETNALETYGAGRFLSAGALDDEGYAYLDFNKAYNPPCAFSPFATCPLPPRENFLPFDVTAGEKAVPH